MTLRNATPAGRLWARVDQSAGPDGCWPWTGYVSCYGYGQIKVDSRAVHAHRLAYELSADEPIPAGMHIDHICHVKLCCNPQHLRVTTCKHTDNPREMQRVADAIERLIEARNLLGG